MPKKNNQENDNDKFFTCRYDAAFKEVFMIWK